MAYEILKQVFSDAFPTMYLCLLQYLFLIAKCLVVDHYVDVINTQCFKDTV